MYSAESLEQLTNQELCDILAIYQEPLGKRVKSDLIMRILVIASMLKLSLPCDAVNAPTP